MADTDWGALIDSDTQASASGALAGVRGVSPAQAQTGLTRGPTAGVAPSVAMRAPDQVTQDALLNDQQGALKASPPVAHFVANADPAHVAAAAPHLPSLVPIADAFHNWLNAPSNTPSSGPFDILGNINDAAMGALGVIKRGMEQGDSGSAMTRLAGVGNEVKGALGVIGSPFAALTEPLAYGMAAIPGPMNVAPDAVYNPFSKPVMSTDPAAKLEAARQNVGLAMFALGPGKHAPISAAEGANAVNEVAPMLRGPLAEFDAQSVKGMQDAVAASPVHASSPSTMQEFIHGQAPNAVVGVDADALSELRAAGHDPFPQADVEGAVATGTQVQVPLSEYITATAGQPFDETLNAASTFRDGGVSLNDLGERGAGAVTPTEPSPEPPEPLTEPEAARAKSIAASYESELQRQVADHYLQPLVTDAKALGMTEDQFGRYSNGVQEAVQDAQDKLYDRAYGEVLRERKPEFKAAVEQHSATAEQALAQRPDLQAYSYLTRGKGVLGEPIEAPFKLDSNDPLAKHGMDLGLPSRMFSKSGLALDDAAEVFGFKSGADMVRALDAVRTDMEARGATNASEHIKALTKDLATNAARAELGYDLTPDSLHQAVSETLTSPKVEDFLSTELRALSEASGLPLDIKALKSYAAARFNTLNVKAALNIKQMEKYVYRGGIKAEKALLKGDYPAAFLRKQQQFLHHRTLAEAHRFTKEYTSATKRFSRWARKPSIPTVDQSYLNYVHDALMQMGYPVKRNPTELLNSFGGVNLDEFIASKIGEGRTIVHGNLPAKPPLEMEVGPFREVNDTLRSLIHNGQEEMMVRTGETQEEFHALIQEINDQFDALGRKFTPKGLEATGFRATAAQIARGVNAPMIKMEQLLDEIDGGNPRGALNRSVTEPMQAAKGIENDLTAMVTKELTDFAKTQPKDWIGSMRRSVAVDGMRYVTDTINEPRITTRGELVRAALNWGNPSNRAKMLEGYGWSEAEVQAAFDAPGGLTKADWDFTQKIWDLQESLWPYIERVYRREAGVPPTKIEGEKFSTPFGDYRGGYFPITYDKLRAPPVKSFSKDSIWGEEYGSALPANPYTVGRTAYVAPINLNFEGLNAGLGQIIHDVAFRSALVQAQKVLMHPDVQRGVQETLGPSYKQQLRPWLEYAARERLNDDTATAVMASIMRASRVNMTFVGLAYRASSAMVHGSVALSDSIAEVGMADFAKAVRDVYLTPGQWSYWHDYVAANSPEVRHRLVNMDNNIREAMEALTKKQGFLEDVQKFGYHLIGLSDQLSTIPTWLAALRQETAKGLSPERAMAVADKRVRQAHGASAPIDVAAMQRAGGGFWHEAGRSTAGMFLSFMNHAYNRLWSIGRQFGKASTQARAGEWAGARRDFSDAAARSIFYTIVPAIAVSLIRGLQHGKEPNDLGSWINGIGHTTIGSVPMAGMVLDMLEGHDPDSPLGQAMKATGATVKNAKAEVTGHGHVSSKWLQQALTTAGYFTGKIPGQAATSAQYLWDFTTGKAHPKDAAQFMHDAVFGQPSKGHH